MFDPMSTYRSTQVTSSSPVGQVILLYEGAIRYGVQHLALLERNDLQGAHNASIRCQQIVAALRETLDLSAGPVAKNLDGLYDFILRRLVAGNVAKDPVPTEQALDLLRELLGAWREIARTPGSATAFAVPPSVPVAAAYPTSARGAY